MALLVLEIFSLHVLSLTLLSVCLRIILNYGFHVW
jgi:hypothetical protein